MTEPVTSQFLLFLYTIMTGILAGLIYEFYAGIGQMMRFKKRVLDLGDILFWLLMITIIYSLLLFYNQGEVRFFVLLGLGIGAVLYFRLFHRTARAIILWLLEQTARLLRLTWRLFACLMAAFFFPFRAIFIIIAFPFRLVNRLARGIAGRIKNIAGRLVPEPCKKVYRGVKRRWSVLKGLLKRK